MSSMYRMLLLSFRRQFYGSGGGTCRKMSTPASWNNRAEASSLKQIERNAALIS